MLCLFEFEFPQVNVVVGGRSASELPQGDADGSDHRRNGFFGEIFQQGVQRDWPYILPLGIGYSFNPSV